MKQRFKRGNLVYVAKDLEECMSHFKSGCKAVVQYSYADKFGGSDTNSYSLIFKNGNSSAWYYGEQLTLIDVGGEHLIKECKKNGKKKKKRDTNLSYVLKKLPSGNLSSTSIICLFNLIGYESRFLRNGEYYILFQEWAMLHPVFCHIKDSSTIDEALAPLSPEIKNLNIKEVFEAFHK